MIKRLLPGLALVVWTASAAVASDAYGEVASYFNSCQPDAYSQIDQFAFGQNGQLIFVQGKGGTMEETFVVPLSEVDVDDRYGFIRFSCNEPGCVQMYSAGNPFRGEAYELTRESDYSADCGRNSRFMDRVLEDLKILQDGQ